ncbi:hypothetical protein [Bradyrhizobium phage BDU-MI-1]|nr:hypothetical protein [Bradyrhizobium phage BDU-MI-1]
MKRASAAQAVKSVPPPPINAKFKDRLPSIIEDICDELLTIEPAVNRLTVHLGEIFDHLDFEIKKADLDVRTMKWEAKVDPAELKRAQDWLAQLQQLKTDFSIDVMTSPPETIRTMVERLQKMFALTI